jgi:hypothetical protein
MLLLLSLPAGCGSGSSDTTTTGATSPSTSPPPSPAAAFSTAVVNTWAEAMQRLVDLLQSRPDAATVRDQVESLKEEYIQKLVAYGQARQDFSTAEKQEVDSLLFMSISALSEEPWYESHMALYKDYSSGNLEFANLLASFNILTQYADFELLKQQEPEEADRLGIE